MAAETPGRAALHDLQLLRRAARQGRRATGLQRGVLRVRRPRDDAGGQDHQGGRQQRPAAPRRRGRWATARSRCKRGMTADLRPVDWFTRTRARTRSLRADGEVVVLAQDGVTERARFVLQRCLPVKLKAPPLNASDGAVAIEELQLVYESADRPRAGGERPCLSPAPSSAPSCTSSTPTSARPSNDDKEVKVQFNPETLKVTYANQIVQNNGAGDQRGSRRASSSAPARPSSRCSCGSTSPLPGRHRAGRRRPQADPAGRLLHHPAQARQRASRLRAAARVGAEVPRRRPCGSSGARSSSTASWSSWRRAWSSCPPTGGRCARASSLAMSQQQITFAFADRDARRPRRQRAAARGPRRWPRPRPAPRCRAWRPAPEPARRGSRSPRRTASRTRCGIQPGSFIDLSARPARGSSR